MPHEVSDEELAGALRAAENDDGVDVRLARMTAAMSVQEREQAQESIRRWAAAARRSREKQRGESDKI